MIYNLGELHEERGSGSVPCVSNTEDLSHVRQFRIDTDSLRRGVKRRPLLRADELARVRWGNYIKDHVA